MKLGALLLVLAFTASACKTSSDDYPIGTGGGGFGGGGGGGGGIDAPDTGTVTAEVCQATLPDNFVNPFTDCAKSGVSGFTLTLDTGTPIALGADGTFMVPSDIVFNAGEYWHVSGAAQVPSLIPVTHGQYILPLIKGSDFTTLIGQNLNAVSTDGNVFIHVVGTDGMTVTQGVTASAVVPAPAAVFYDNGTIAWDPNAQAGTKAGGTIWLNGVTGSAVTLTLTHAAKTAVLSNIAVATGTNTYVFVEMPD